MSKKEEESKKAEEKKKKVKKPTIVKKSTEMLKCILTDPELLSYGQRLADAQQEIVELQAELTSFKADNKSKTESAEGDVGRFSNVIRQKYEHRKVEVTVLKNYQAETVTKVRQDTLETVESRKMTKEELEQLPLDDQPAK